MERMGIAEDLFLKNTLINFYAKCGRLKVAEGLFNGVKQKGNIETWNTLLSAYGKYGKGQEALRLLKELRQTSLKPNGITFYSVLMACNHNRLADESLEVLHSMKECGVAPGEGHVCCIIDAFAGSGRIKEAEEIMLQLSPTLEVWLTFLTACRNLGDAQRAENACSQIFKMDPNNPIAFTLLANTYANAGSLSKRDDVLKEMEKRGIKRFPPCSKIEIFGQMHSFSSGDDKHPQIHEINDFVNEMFQKMDKEGLLPSGVSARVEKMNADHPHSELLAIAYGLMATPDSALFITKNLRVCPGCHQIIKAISMVYKREIIIKEMTRFHHFKEGTCSCLE
eukprot:TRINITY_DN7082_c0_g1_i1.p1 TRINITY_DN7082_c0_g1~~TRINITY_DN7082_c0_g1_i1.p1  ORF type:complete len:338 (+),score=81.50 TRINITY_DN7082_c0_g1_i1:947-1960(+)